MTFVLTDSPMTKASLDSKMFEKLETLGLELKYFKKGERIIKESSPSNGCYFLKSGSCKAVKAMSSGKNSILHFAVKDDFIGLESVMKETSFELEVVALEEVEALFIPKSKVLLLYGEDADFRMRILEDVARDLGNKNIAVANMAQKEVQARVADVLLDLEKKFGVDEEGFINIKLSRSEIAEYVGAATEDIIRRIGEFKKDEIIEVRKRGKIKIVNKSRLKRVSDGFRS